MADGQSVATDSDLRFTHAIADFFEGVQWTSEPHDVYDSMADVLVRVLGCDTASIRLLTVSGNEMVGCASSGAASSIVMEQLSSLPVTTGRMPQLIETHEPIFIDFANPDYRDVHVENGIELGYRYAVTIPLVSGDNLVGVADFAYREGQFHEGDLAGLIDIGRILGVALYTINLSERMTHLRLLDETKRIAAEVNDNLIQPISVVGLEADKALMSLEDGDYDSLQSELTRLRTASQQACDLTRQEVYVLENTTGEDKDIVEDIDSFLNRFGTQWGMDVSFQCAESTIVVASRVANQVMQILNESLANVLAHSRASAVSVMLDARGGVLRLCVEDNGCGFDVRDVSPDKMGIRIMKERANRVGGRLVVASVPGEGTSVNADIPLYE